MRRIVKVWENKTAYQTPSYPTQLNEINGDQKLPLLQDALQIHALFKLPLLKLALYTTCSIYNLLYVQLALCTTCSMYNLLYIQLALYTTCSTYNLLYM